MASGYSVPATINVSRMDNEITLSHRQLMRNSQGEQVPTWKQYARVWAEKRDLRGNQRFEAQAYFQETLTEFTLRWLADVLATDRITVLDSGAVYEIIQISEIPRHMGLDLLCRTITP